MSQTRAGVLPPVLLLVMTMASSVIGAEPGSVRQYNVVWDSPSADSSGSMPLGNGEIGLNVWVEQGGDLLLYIARTDAWSENARLLKLGRMRVTLDPNPFAGPGPFRQELRLGEGEIEVRAGPDDVAVLLRVWVDANHPVVRIECQGRRDFRLQVGLETWRTAERKLEGGEMFSAYGLSGAPHPVIVYPDTVLPASGDRILWFHRNRASLWPETLALQGMGDWAKQAHDPLLNRTFGGLIRGEGLVSAGPAVLRSAAPRKSYAVSVHTLTAQTATPDEWVRRIEQQAAEVEAVPLEQARQAHGRWWQAFWDRSWIRVRGSSSTTGITTNDLPLRIGACSDGANQFRGLVAQPRVYSRALTPEEVRALASGPTAAPAGETGLLGHWTFETERDGLFPNAVPGGPAARAVGEVEVTDAPGGRALRLTGKGWVEVADDPAFDLTQAVTLAAWVQPEQLPDAGGRILDKSRAGTSNGYLLDTYPGNSLRMIVEPSTLSYDARLPAGRWSHVAATFDAATGPQRLYHNGEVVAQRSLGATGDQVSQAYALQRFIAACAGRGAYPIKFNGSLFTVDAREGEARYDADYRRWGGPYWFQNTRLPYWPMLASGDFDALLPLLRMYLQALPLALERTRLYFGHDGAFFPETMYFWGSYANENYGWNREGKPVSQVDNTYIRHYFSGALELLAMMLDYRAYTQDDDFARTMLLPLADAVVTFYDRHYARDEAGKVLFEPAQALETWQKAINPLPPIAGLRFTLQGLLSLPQGLATPQMRAHWERLLAELPDLPTAEADGEQILAPARDILEPAKNAENPELYAVFPYRLCGVDKPDLELARRTFAQRRIKGSRGWQQDDTQAAFLGLAQQARTLLTRRFADTNPGSRFPVFWGPNFDWIPDQDHGSNGLMALQTMILQAHGQRILLFPAWPAQWDVEFRLCAPLRTTVEGSYRDGKLEWLKVDPPARARDVVVLDPQPESDGPVEP